MVQMPDTQHQVSELRVEVAKLRADLRTLTLVVLDLKTQEPPHEPSLRLEPVRHSAHRR